MRSAPRRSAAFPRMGAQTTDDCGHTEIGAGSGLRPLDPALLAAAMGGSRHVLLTESRGCALGQLESGPDVHVDDDADDLEDLLLREVLCERGVTQTEIVGDGRVSDASDRLGVREGGAGGVVV